MQKLKIATWNVNSVRHRINLVTRFLRDEQPDVLCLQETKVLNELFPAEAFRRLGYCYQAIHGQKAYHGVAVLAKKPFRETGSQDFCREGHARHMGVTWKRRGANFQPPAATFPIPRRTANSPTSCTSCRRWKSSLAAAKRGGTIPSFWWAT